MRPFLTADWKNLILLTYAVEPGQLMPYLPEGLDLDYYKGRCFVSFVAFDFLNTSVWGLPVPFHRRFPEVNLRFYVRHQPRNGPERRGVVFIREFVPKPLVTWVANSFYQEHYKTVPLKNKTRLEDGEWMLQYRLKAGGMEHSWTFYADNEPYIPAEDSTDHFFKEHEWGFGRDKKGQLTHYRVEHPTWRVYPLSRRFELNVDFGAMYGEVWSFLNSLIPYHIMVAEGSPIQVFPEKVLVG